MSSTINQCHIHTSIDPDKLFFNAGVLTLESDPQANTEESNMPVTTLQQLSPMCFNTNIVDTSPSESSEISKNNSSLLPLHFGHLTTFAFVEKGHKNSSFEKTLHGFTDKVLFFLAFFQIIFIGHPKGHLRKTLSQLLNLGQQHSHQNQNSSNFMVTNISTYRESESSSTLEKLKTIFFEQDLTDGFLTESDRKPYFKKSDLADDSTKTFYLVQLHKSSSSGSANCSKNHNSKDDRQISTNYGGEACLTLSQLCGHGDPKVNMTLNRPSLRRGKNRIWNGVRCCSSAASVKAVWKVLLEDVVNSKNGPPQQTKSRQLYEGTCPALSQSAYKNLILRGESVL